ncbi:DNA-binding transcriptional MerR regulator [Catenuloplanes nepalensis]|uniref:DNA-binding transcriptional MerR regulator n=1 Tax=Catenuloplanes nepalensis TaxID=587533 RepID=A0ABT9MVT6_9ACTN|nr:MerR family transcriptional regulator [Catenuloplanes nepalensis]MDP9795553.1 DNA-binding transcriptional MerR regulator [Catenuloplanes nepalensis]
MDLMTYTPAEAAEKTGLTLDTLRYYERSGLLNDVERTSGGRRVYTDAHLGWLDVLVCLRRTGMPIRQIQRFVDSAGRTQASVRLRILEAHRADVLREMEEQRRALGVIDGKIDAYRRLEKEEHPNE